MKCYIKSSLRISLGGWYRFTIILFQNWAFYICCNNKYTYVSVSNLYWKNIFKIFKIWRSRKALDIKNSLIRETLLEFSEKPNDPIEVNSFADVPSGTGLGSSGCFTVTFLRSLASFYKKYPSQRELAEIACKVEIERLKEPVGKQDQYISAFGGINSFEIDRSGKVKISPIPASADTLDELESNLLLFYTGQQRSASSILKDQEKRSSLSDKEIFENLHKTKELGKISFQLLKDSKLKQFALLMHEHWMNKRKRSSGMSNDFMDKVYDEQLIMEP